MQCTRIREVRNVLVDYGALALISMVNSLRHTTTRERERKGGRGGGEGGEREAGGHVSRARKCGIVSAIVRQ